MARAARPGPGLVLATELPHPGSLLDEWATWMRAGGKAAKTISERTRIIAQAVSGTACHPLDFTPAALASWLADLPSAATRVTYYRALTAFHTWLLRTGQRGDDPTVHLDRPPEKRRKKLPVTTVGLARLLNASCYYRTTREMILLAAYQGFRCAEISRMDSGLIHLDHGLVELLRKGGKVEHVPLHPVVAAWAARWHPDRGPWFPAGNRAGGTVRPSSVSRQVSEAMGRAGVSGTAHALRRWYATTMVDGGADLVTVQELLGHERLETTRLYVASSLDAKRAAVALLPDLTTPERAAAALRSPISPNG